MAQGFYGADPDQLRALAKQFSTGSNQIRSSLETVSSLVNSGQNWRGPDASAFVQRWNSSVKSLGNTVVHALEVEATTLAKNADEQTAASSVGGSGGPGASGAPGNPAPGGPGAPGSPGSQGSSTPWDAFRDGWKNYGLNKALVGLPKNLYGLNAMWNLGPEIFRDADMWKLLPELDDTYRVMETLTDGLGLKNLNKYFPVLDGAKGFFEEAPLFFTDQGKVMESLGKGGLGRGLGWLGVGLSAFDTVNYAAEGKTGDAVWSGVKTAMGVACFLPPPAGTVFQVASAAVAIYEIPVVKEFVNGSVAAAGDALGKGFDAVGKGYTAAADTVSEAIKNPDKFISDVGKGIGDLGKGVADFFG
ncbi:WXG100 family type VII secretion target [Agreia sp.]|uniref:WXG100 family type VII secretion target n=1 Tax=Agreia sp. TaxID=1872416 RepID=UPI0035BC34D0